MCGIAGVFLRDDDFEVNLEGMLDTLLDEIEHRGGDATGFVSLNAEGVSEWQKASCGAREFSLYRRPIPKGSRSFICHTRWATQGLPAFTENNHPLKRGDFFIVHNGHVVNDDELFKLADRTPYGQVDSEAIAARLSSLGKLDSVQTVMQEIDGGAAIAAVSEAEPDRLVLARGYSSPLFVLCTKRIVVFASTKTAVETAWSKHIGRLPKKTKIEEVKQGTVLSYKRGTKSKRSSFRPYTPPKVVKTLPSFSGPWKDSSTETVKKVVTPVYTVRKDEDQLDCDGCSVLVPWTRVEYRQDEEGYTLLLCSDCAIDYDDGVPLYHGLSRPSKEVYDDFEGANDASLAQ